MQIFKLFKRFKKFYHDSKEEMQNEMKKKEFINRPIEI